MNDVPFTLPEPAGAAEVRKLRAELWQKGYAPVPIATGGKACYYTGWPERARAGEFADCIFDPALASTGIECAGLRAIDVDVDDPTLVDAIYTAAEEAGLPEPGAVRYRENSSRVLWLYQAVAGQPGKRVLTGRKDKEKDKEIEKEKIEILGRGQQFVCDGLHPTGVPIRWDSDLDFPDCLPHRDELPVLTEEQITTFLATVAPLIESQGEHAHASAPGGTAAPPTPDELKSIDRDALAAIVRQLPNDSTFDNRDAGWLALAHALAAAFADDPALAEELWLEHAAKREQKVRDDGEGEAEFVWRTLNPPHRAGAEYIVSIARRLGIDVSRYDAARGGAAFAASPLPAESLAGGPGEPPPELPPLIVHAHDRPATVRALRAVLAKAPDLFDRGGVPVLLTHPADNGPPAAKPLTYHTVVYEAHNHCQPVKINSKGDLIPMTLPDAVARMFLDLGDRGLRPLAGISTAPLLTTSGAILADAGYDRERSLWCEPICDLAVPDQPARADAEAALAKLRDAFKTFPFADAVRAQEDDLLVVDTTTPPGTAESSLLCALLTAVCRPSLWLAPGLLIVAPEISGAGSGKGMLARALCLIAFGAEPAAFTPGHDRQELDKRLVAELIGAAPSMLLDNCNSTALRSDMLASVLTERPARVRLMGVSEMVPLNCTALMAITGNGLSVSEDLARRFLTVDLDPQCEDPESRPFKPGFLQIIRERRAELLCACLTIWRWGRHNAGGLKRGLPLGSFEIWTEWVRDPLLALGCADPVERIRQAKANDPRRQNVAALFAAWWQQHGERPVKAAGLAETVLTLLDPQAHGRQYVARRLMQMTGTRNGGFVLTYQPPAAGSNVGGTYALKPTAPPNERHPAPESPESSRAAVGRGRGG